MLRQIVLDTETTGLSTAEGHHIIEIAAVELINRKLTGKHFHYYINPEREIEKGAENIHGITIEFLKDKPKFSQIADEFLDFIKNTELIIHNALFDIGFLEYELKLINHQTTKLKKICKIIDTLTLARNLHPGQKNNLDALCKRYSVDNSSRNLHGALLDANLLAHIYLPMTGGQGTLFGESEEILILEKDKAHHKDFIKNKLKLLNLVVLKASPEEIQLHEKRLQEIHDIAK